ncbi:MULTISPECIES: SLC13 family permease [Lysinibacillus]|uniref:SLC13 family permease n=2 Tax=Lysinibacillus TaxID=400634 RepID=A0ABY2TDC1_9BACI|nr:MULTISPECIES: SLC13 family permease [Lysinibacillus]AHN20208.1 di- and tricarboxylate transporter [Lysinibacillus varians]TKI44899.1 SLC13 family permease [Lysinibacillus tabacifolii]TKI66335.1 SLC13 family permease [Lysinibacillus varians]
MLCVQLTLTFLILGMTIIVFMTNRVRADFVAIVSLLAFVIANILTPAEALAGFSNSVVLMIAGLFVVGAGILRTGLAAMAGQLLLKWSGNSELKLFILLLIIVGSVGAFMSNTGTVALMMPIVVSIAISMKESPSKFLLPLSYVASLSGLMTLIASPPNLIVSQLLVDQGYPKLGFFEVTPIGLVGMIVGILYLVLVRNILLPNDKKRTQTSTGYKLSPKKIMKQYDLNNRLFKVFVPEDSTIIGTSLAELKLPAKYGLCMMKIHRKSQDGINLLPMTYQEMAGPTSVIHALDELYVQGEEGAIGNLTADYGLVMQELTENEADELVTKHLGIAEVLLTPNSSFINETVSSLGFREKYNLNIIGINHRGGYKLQDMVTHKLKFGDAILVQGAWDEILVLARETQDVVVVGQPKEHASVAAATGKAGIAGAIMLLMIGLMAFEVFPAVISVMVGAVLMIITGCLRNMEDAYNNMNFESIVLVAAMLPMATALEKTGGMVILSNGIIDVLGKYGPYGVLIGIYVLTVIFGQFISNTATAVLFAPIAMNAAIAMDANPTTFMIGVAVAASMAFATPIASPTNALVMTAGGYKFMDFVKIGVPLQVIMFIVMMLAVPFFFPF